MRRFASETVTSTIKNPAVFPSKPLPSPQTVLLRKSRASPFRPRNSQLDLRQIFTPANSGRGWFVLFWIAMVCYLVRQFAINFIETGYPIKTTWVLRLSEGVTELIMADLAVVAYSFIPLLVQRAVVRGTLEPDSMASYIIQHTVQTLLLQVVVSWLFYIEWPWVQTGVLLLHTLVIMMKMHSYTSTNREFAVKLRRRDELIVACQAYRETDSDSCPETLSSSPPFDDTTLLDDYSQLAQWQEEIAELNSELALGDTKYPANVTFLNYVDYLFVPALVYEIYYPRTDKIRPEYLAEKICATFGVFTLLHVTFENYIIPILGELPHISMAMTILELITPVMIAYLLVFYIIFECICNVFAEITRFADRNFYDDWWNSTSFDEYSRKWNKPVHYFLLRHVYLYSIDMYRFSRTSATFLTFFMSSCLHELVMAMVVGRIRMYLFLLQMAQIPLIYLSRLPWVKARPLLGNAFFWLGMISGPPMLAVLYCRDQYLS
ncbi:MBOAT, membrane-bound O-acyltransferase family-domain-containing protein [Dimargaris cristalligena]|uniref:O-acyltransferase n=1 Tax=Dimargaris cristalligena TaxID=215637 RepID=A0A4P9ZXL4_9FUNG|nr:MBOAT, membrane-bound O-acyltransferase family-domain-containing protein [Dimargaris cristalligena]|eukprot:RKP38406.1 MBOAT, membrane-bound O-acyltransferase family-domain-containing protein [Dimargaris cristalligena]